jgi:hypothetical protein
MKTLIPLTLFALILGGCGYLPGDDDDDDTNNSPGTLLQVTPGGSPNTPTNVPDGTKTLNCQLNLSYEGTTFTPCVAMRCTGACTTLQRGCAMLQEDGVQVESVSVCSGNAVASASGSTSEGNSSLECHAPNGDEPTRQFCMELASRLSQSGD